MKTTRKGEILRSAALFLAVLVITPLLVLSCSCEKTAQNNTIFRDSSQVSRRTDSINKRTCHWQDTQRHDSIYKQDSVVVYIKGDTIIKERWHLLTTTKWKTTTKTDTIVGDTYVCMTDTIKVKYYVNRYKTKQVEKPMSTWKRARLFVGDCVLLFLALVAVNWLRLRIQRKDVQ